MQKQITRGSLVNVQGGPGESTGVATVLEIKPDADLTREGNVLLRFRDGQELWDSLDNVTPLSKRQR